VKLNHLLLPIAEWIGKWVFGSMQSGGYMIELAKTVTKEDDEDIIEYDKNMIIV
jgi:hypothetical protein